VRKTGTLTIFVLLLAGAFFVPLFLEDTGADTLNDFETGVSEGLPSDGDYNAIAIGNFNGDDHVDMAFGGEDYSSADTTGLYAYAGNGEGSWTSISNGLPTQDSWGGTAFGDADGDGKMELYAGNEGWGSDSGAIKGVGAWEYSGGSWSTSGISSPHPTKTVNDLRLLDFTKGPGLDIALTTSTGGDGGVRVYYGSGSDPISWTDNSVGLPTSGEYAGIDVRDFNDDDLKDIATVGYGAGGLHIYTQNDGGNGWTDHSSTLPSDAKSGAMLGVVIGDVNNDESMDIIYTHRDKGMRLILGNDGGSPGGSAFVWVERTDGLPSSASSGRFSQIQLADIDKDGDLDLLGAKANSGLRLYLGNGSEEPGDHVAFTEVTNKGLPTSGTFYGSNYLDLDDDGDLDVSGATWGNGVQVYGTNLDSGNQKPVADAGDYQEVYTGDPVTLDGSGSSDPEDGDDLDYEWTVEAGNPEEVTLSDNHVVDPGFTAPDTPGDYEFTLRVKDTQDTWSDPDTVTVRVLNRAPVADAGEDQDAYTDDSVTLDGSNSSDPEDGDELDYEWTVDAGNPEEITLSDDQVVNPGFTAPQTHGDYKFTLRVKDSQDQWSDPDEVVVHVLNLPPVADAGVDLTRTVDELVTLNGSRSEDTDGTIEHYNWSCTSHSITLDSADSASPSFTPEEEGTFVFTLGVQDNDGVWSNAEDTVNVTVVPKGVNLVPSGDAGPDQEIVQGAIAILNGSGSEDPDGEIISWEWNCTSHDDISLENPNSSAPSFVPKIVGTYTFALRVKDSNETWSSKDYVNITVMPPPEPPVADAGEDFTVEAGTLATLDGSGSSDPDGFVVEYDWTCTSHTVVLDDSGGQASPSFTPDEEGIYVFTLAVKDNDGLWSENEAVVNVTVTPAKENSAPVVELIYPSGGENLSGDVTISWMAYDPDGDPLLFTIEVSTDSGATYTTLKADFTVTVRAYEWSTDSASVPNGEHYRIRVTATDTNDSAKSSSVETADFAVYNPTGNGGDGTPPDDDDDSGFIPGFELIVLVGAAWTGLGLYSRKKRR